VTVMFCDLVDSTGIAAQLDAEEWRDLVGGSLRVSLRESNSWRRNSAFRGGGIGSAHRSSHLCVDRSGANEPARRMPTPAADGLPNPARVNVLACLHDPRHAQQSRLHRTRSLRASTLFTSSATAAARRPRFGRDRVKSGHNSDIAKVKRLTLNVDFRRGFGPTQCVKSVSYTDC
jgi:hypothetical protein